MRGLAKLVGRPPNVRSRIIHQQKSSKKKAGQEKVMQGMGEKTKQPNILTKWKIFSPRRI